MPQRGGAADMAEPIRAVIFDVFGTLVDWRTGIAREVHGRLGRRVADPEAVADAWRALYQPSMEAVRSGQRPYAKLDVLHRESLDRVLADLKLHDVDEPTRRELTLAWHRLDAWPDVKPALLRLRERFRLAPCSNGNIALMADLARRNGLPWDTICGADLARDYKPKPAVYRAAADAFDCRPAEVLMVAAHSSDLAAAEAAGLRTAFVARPQEMAHGRGERHAAQPVDYSAPDLAHLATQLGT
jgi:2-haloacid dehalogenase